MAMAQKGKQGRKSKGEPEKTEERKNIGVSIDAVLWRRLRALAILEGKGTGELLDAAIREYLEKYEK
jgi:metal-responsive CopG/Arc/MetJ family transcriptional regulator